MGRPGVGIKSAQRMAWHLLQHDRDGARRIAEALQSAVVRVRHCQRCHTFTEAAFFHLEAPVLRCTGLDIPYPPARLEEAHLPGVDRVLWTVQRSLDF